MPKPRNDPWYLLPASRTGSEAGAPSGGLRKWREGTFFCCHMLKHRAHRHLRLGLLSLRNCEQGMLFRPPSLWHFCYSSLNRLRRQAIPHRGKPELTSLML